jgi:rhodanese-related sulfurtransferase/ABC-type phosphate/phosphonate transport system substrate-binding protein
MSVISRSMLFAMLLAPIACMAQIKVLVAVDPSEQKSGSVQTLEISSGLMRATGKPVRTTHTENLSEAMRSTRTGDYDLYIAPAHVSASAMNHGYELLGSNRQLRAYVLMANAETTSVAQLRHKRLYLSQEDSVAAYIAKGMLNEAGQSLKTFDQVLYKRTTGAGLFAVGASIVDATVAPEDEVEEWMRNNPGKGRVLLKSQPVPLGMTALVKSSLPEDTKARVAAWFAAPDAFMPGIGRMEARHDVKSYKYVASLGHFTPAQLPGAKRVNAHEVQALVAGGALMADVRSAKEWTEGHVPGAVNLPYGEKSLKDVAYDTKADSFPGLDTLDPKRAIIFGCNGAECWKSYKAARAAVSKGFVNVYWFRGGLPEWRAEGLAVNKGEAVTNTAQK